MLIDCKVRISMYWKYLILHRLDGRKVYKANKSAYERADLLICWSNACQCLTYDLPWGRIYYNISICTHTNFMCQVWYFVTYMTQYGLQK